MNPNSKPCWPLIILWIASTAQYAYRYILQVNDPRSSHIYGPTPGFLSALKYEILVLFAVYAIVRFWMNPAALGARYRILCTVSGVLVLAISLGLLIRVLFDPGVWDETTLCALQFVPWVATAFLVPLVVSSQHSTRQTLLVFERLMFWVTFPFWLATVVLATAGLRYPNLSYPGSAHEIRRHYGRPQRLRVPGLAVDGLVRRGPAAGHGRSGCSSTA